MLIIDSPKVQISSSLDKVYRIAFYLKVLKSNLELIKSCEFVAIFYEPNKNGHNFYNSFFVLFSNLSVPNSNMLSIKS